MILIRTYDVNVRINQMHLPSGDSWLWGEVASGVTGLSLFFGDSDMTFVRWINRDPKFADARSHQGKLIPCSRQKTIRSTVTLFLIQTSILSSTHRPQSDVMLSFYRAPLSAKKRFFPISKRWEDTSMQSRVKQSLRRSYLRIQFLDAFQKVANEYDMLWFNIR